MSRHATFENFGMAFLTLFQVSTGDNWNGIMKVLGQTGPRARASVLLAVPEARPPGPLPAQRPLYTGGGEGEAPKQPGTLPWGPEAQGGAGEARGALCPPLRLRSGLRC